jgi:hypothetical protein
LSAPQPTRLSSRPTLCFTAEAAVAYGYGYGADSLVCQVRDDGPGIADPDAGSVRPEARARHGRGLWMTRQLSQDVHITSKPGGTTAPRPCRSTPTGDSS